MKLRKFIHNILILLTVGIFSMLITLYIVEINSKIPHALFYRYFGDKTIFTELVKQEGLTTPNKIARYLQKNYKYKTDQDMHNQYEYWQTPLETYQLESGDCEDFALLAQELLNQIGITAQVYGIVIPGGAHAICIFRWRRAWYVFDNQYLDKTDYNSPRDMIIRGYKASPFYSVIH